MVSLHRGYAIMLAMIRIQVQLKERQLHRLQALAAERGLSIYALVRYSVDNILAEMRRGPHTGTRSHCGNAGSGPATTD